MKPRIFIGSSGKARKYAEAVHDSLTDVAECTVWTEGAFGLSASTLDNLSRNLRDSDFGAFIFAADDRLSMNGDFLNVPRDNVVFEAGLFSGYLCPERCFIAIPQSVKVHVLTDLLGFTVGQYEDQRTDKKLIPAVGPFARKIRDAIEAQGLFRGTSTNKLHELITQFECCDWIRPDASLKDQWEPRVQRKRQVWAQLETFCSTHHVNKHRLLSEQGVGRFIALLVAIRSHPEDGDCDLVQQMDVAHLPAGFAQDHLMDVAELLKEKKICAPDQLASLCLWLKKLREPSSRTLDRIDKLATS